MPTLRTVTKLIPGKREALTNEASVLRALPRREMRRVGPFVFCDHFGPAPASRASMDVPPHPHVGLETVTYLLSGAVRHRDSIGSEQVIRPGDVNWMTAGRGIVHDERALAEGEALHGIQTWVALPPKDRDVEPAFRHFPSSSLPFVEAHGYSIRVIAGSFSDRSSPVPTYSPTTYLDIALHPSIVARLPVDESHELAIYVAEGAVSISGTDVSRGTLARLSEGGDSVELVAGVEGARVLLLGGAPLEEPMVIHWNFVVGSQAEGKARFADWEAGLFPRLPFED